MNLVSPPEHNSVVILLFLEKAFSKIEARPDLQRKTESLGAGLHVIKQDIKP